MNFCGEQNRIYAPIAGWRASDLAVGSDGAVRILWSNASANAASLWTLDANLNPVFAPVYGGSGLAGWQALHLDAGADGLLRLQWDRVDGTTALWLLNAAGALQSAGVFGPF